MCWNYVRREKKVAISAYFFNFFLRLAVFTLLDLSIFPLKKFIFTENLSICPVLFFFPPTSAGREILFLFFFPPTLRKNPCRDPSSVEYNESCLILVVTLYCCNIHVLLHVQLGREVHFSVLSVFYMYRTCYTCFRVLE